MLELHVFDINFDRVGIIDVFDSFIFTERYRECGNFELQLNAFSNEFKMLRKYQYIKVVNDNTLLDDEVNLLIVEDIKVTIDEEKGSTALISGRSISSLLDRRILWGSTWYAGSINEGVKKILQKNVINPDNPNRKIENFIYRDTTDHRILKLGMEINKTGDNLLDLITNICNMFDIGFNVWFKFSTKKFIFELYKGIDRGKNNSDGNLVIEFSNNNDNLLKSDFVDAYSKFKNTILIGGEGEDDRKYFSNLGDNHKNLNRREMYYSSSIQREVEDKLRLSIPEYERQLKEEGKIQLKSVEETTAFDGDVRALDIDMYALNRDFALGDTVYIKNAYNMHTDSIITETVESYNEQGYSIVPTFKSFKKKPAKVEGTIYIDSENKTFSFSGIPSNKKVNIDWGDGNISENITGSASHNYAVGEASNYTGLYDFKISMSDNSDMEFCPVFRGSKVLYKIEVPNGVPTIQANTFRECSLLNQVYLPPSVKTLSGTEMFYKCDNLYSISLPNSITSVQSNTFHDCPNLLNCDFPFGVATVPSNFFNNCPLLKEVKFTGNSLSGVGVKVVNANAINNCDKVNTLVFGSTITSINGSCLTKTSQTDDNKVSIQVMKYAETSNQVPTLVGGHFSFNINDITVPNSLKFDDTVLNAYKTAWSSHSSIIKEEDGEIEQQNYENSDYSYANNSVDEEEEEWVEDDTYPGPGD